MLKKIILIILIIFLFIICFREFTIYYNFNLDKSFSITYDETLELITKGSKYNNYYRTTISDLGKEEYYYKDNILTYFVNSELKYWMNISENEKEMIIIENAENKIANIVSDFNDINFPVENTQNGYFCWLYYSSDFECLGVTEHNDRPTIIVRVKKEPNNINTAYTYYYIDKETGVIVKRTEIEKMLFITTKTTNFDRNLIFDIVTEENIKKPNLDEFEVNTIHCPTITVL